ncbi:hypothetical protein RCL1_005165 [Eukaryota sp. TZLM3-RCL]
MASVKVAIDLGSWGVKLFVGAFIDDAFQLLINGDPSFINAMQINSSNRPSYFGVQALRHWMLRESSTLVSSSHVLCKSLIPDQSFTLYKFRKHLPTNYKPSDSVQPNSTCPSFIDTTLSIIKDILEQGLSPFPHSLSILISLPNVLLEYSHQFKRVFSSESKIVSVEIVPSSYGLISSFLFTQKERNCRVAFIDVGFTLTKFSVAHICQKEVQLIEDEEIVLGGRDVEQILVDYFVKKLSISTARDEITILKSIQANMVLLDNPSSSELHLGTVEVNSEEVHLRLSFATLNGMLKVFRQHFSDFLTSFCTIPVDFVVVTGGSSHLYFIDQIIEKQLRKPVHRILNPISDISRGTFLYMLDEYRPMITKSPSTVNGSPTNTTVTKHSNVNSKDNVSTPKTIAVSNSVDDDNVVRQQVKTLQLENQQLLKRISELENCLAESKTQQLSIDNHLSQLKREYTQKLSLLQDQSRAVNETSPLRSRATNQRKSWFRRIFCCC